MDATRWHLGADPRVPTIAAMAALLAVLAAALLLATSVLAENAPPEARIDAPADGAEVGTGEVVTFDGRSSTDEDVANLTYEWNFSGVIVSGRDMAMVDHTFHLPGDYIVALRVIDVGGRDDTAYVIVHVTSENVPPVAVITSPADGGAFLGGKTITFDGRQSYDPDGGTLVYRWEFNVSSDAINSPRFTMTLPLGRYRVTLLVYDPLGAQGSAAVNISVESNEAPTLSGGAMSPELGPHDLPGGFNFSVIYTDPDNEPPVQILVKVGPRGQTLTGHPMVPTDPGDTDYRDGRTYHALVPLSLGSHSLVFTCRDRFFTCSTTPVPGPVVYEVQTLEYPSNDAVVTVNWTAHGTVTVRSVPLPGTKPVDTLLMSRSVRVIITGGEWSAARLRLAYSETVVVNETTITLLWYDASRGLWVPASGQTLDLEAATVEGTVPSQDTVLAVFGQLDQGYENRPPDLVISYDIDKAYVNERMWFDANGSEDPDGTVLLFYWDFSDDGQLGPWVAGVRVQHLFERKGTFQVTLMAIDGQDKYYAYENVTVRERGEEPPGPFDNPGALYLLASMLVVTIGIAVAYRLHRPRTYDDLFGKAYRQQEEDEYSQLFRKLTEEELRGGWDEGPEEDEELEGEGPEQDAEPEDEGGLEEEPEEPSTEEAKRRAVSDEDAGPD